MTKASISGFVLDTCVFVAAERGTFDLAAFIARSAGTAFAISSITTAELLAGVEHANSPARKKQKSAVIENYLSIFAVLEFDLPCARRWSELAVTLQKKGQPVGAFDLLIAATALHHNYGVVTFNAKDFQRIPGLVVQVPTQE